MKEHEIKALEVLKKFSANKPNENKAIDLMLNNDDLKNFMYEEDDYNQKLIDANKEGQIKQLFDEIQNELIKKQQQELKSQQNPVITNVTASGDDKKTIIQAYNQMLTEKGYDPKKFPPINEKSTQNPLQLPFKSEQDAKDFFKQMADNETPFCLVDKDNKLIAYSDGDGKLKGPDGNDFDLEGPLKAADNAPKMDITQPPLGQIAEYQKQLKESSGVELGVMNDPQQSTTPTPND